MPLRSGRQMFSSDLRLLPEQRAFLKAPLGILIHGHGGEVWDRALSLIEELRPKMVVSVGDETSRLFTDHGRSADVYVVDGHVMRSKVSATPLQRDEGLRIVNPAGHISRSAWEVVGRAISIGGGAVVWVEGEEDLLTLVAILEVPVGSVIFYGQPGEGLVAVHVTESKRHEIAEFVRSMERMEGHV